jgi:hypothetical protein
VAKRAIPQKLGGATVLAVCLPKDYLRLSDNDGMWGVEVGVCTPFQSLAVCADDKSGGVFVFYCIADWTILADSWYETEQRAFDAIEKQYPGISAVLSRPRKSHG